MSSQNDLMPEVRALFKLFEAGDRHLAAQLLDSLDADDMHALVFKLVGAVNGSIEGCFQLFGAVGPLLAQAGFPGALDGYADAVKRQFDEALGTTFSTKLGEHHGA